MVWMLHLTGTISCDLLSDRHYMTCDLCVPDAILHASFCNWQYITCDFCM